MRKLVFGVGALFVLAIIAYSFLWYHQANKIKLISQKLANSSLAGIKGSKFSYSGMDVYGFPFRFIIEINNPHFISADVDFPVELSSNEAISVSSNMAGSNINFVFPKKVNVLYGAADKKVSLLTEYNEEPVLNIEFKEGLVSSAFGEVDGAIAYNIESINYSDGGYVSHDEISGEQVISSGKTFLDLYAGERDGRSYTDLKVGVVNFNGGKFMEQEGLGDPLGKINFSADVTLVGSNDVSKIDSSDINMQIRDLSLGADLFSLSLKGDLDFVKDDIFPAGNLRLDVKNYENFIDYQSALINLRMENSMFPIFRVEDRQRDAFKEFLRQVASEGMKSDLTFDFRKEKGGSIFVGDRSFVEMVALFRDVYSGNNVSNKSDNSENVNLNVDGSDIQNNVTEGEKSDIIEPVSQDEKAPTDGALN